MKLQGQDNTNEQCTIGYVPNIFSGVLGDHSGTFRVSFPLILSRNDQDDI